MTSGSGEAGIKTTIHETTLTDTNHGLLRAAVSGRLGKEATRVFAAPQQLGLEPRKCYKAAKRFAEASH